MKRNKTVVFLFVSMLVSLLFLGACKDKTTTTTKREPNLTNVSVQYIKSDYAFNTGDTNIPYNEGITFNASDFKLVEEYDDGTTKDVTDGFSFVIYKLSGSGDVAQTGNLMPGDYRIDFTYNGYTNFINFCILPINVLDSDITSSLNASYPYNPNGSVEPDFTLSYKDTLLVKEEDYIILNYGANNEVGENSGSINIQFRGIYTGTTTLTFSITPIQIGDVVLTDKEVIYSPNRDFREDAETINLFSNPIEGVDRIEYSYKYNDQVIEGSINNAGSYTVTAHIVVLPGYQAVEDKVFTLSVNKFDITTLNLSNSLPKEVEYTGHRFRVEDFDDQIKSVMGDITYSVEMNEGADIDNLKASTTDTKGQYTITAEGNYGGAIIVRYDILPFDVRNVSVETEDFYEYDSTEKHIKRVFRTEYDENGNPIIIELELGKDYTIDYANNINASTSDYAAYVITGKGNYCGMATGKFYIHPVEIKFELDEYYYAHPETTYNGKDQKDYLLALNKALPEQVEVTYYDADNKEVTELKNANTYMSRLGQYVSANFYIKDEYKGNYYLSGADSFSDLIKINPKVLGTCQEEYSTSTLESFEGTKNLDYGYGLTDYYYYTYSGSSYAPKVTIKTILDSKEYTLVEGVDYKLEYSGDNYYADYKTSLTVTNAGHYYVHVVYYMDETQNFAAYEGVNGAYKVYGEFSRMLEFVVTKKELSETSEIAEWPTVQKLIWTDYGYFNPYSKTTTTTMEVEIREKTEEVSFSILDSELDGDGGVYVLAESDNYILPQKKVIAVETTPFSYFNVSGQSLSTDDLKSKTTFHIFDKLDIGVDGSTGCIVQYSFNDTDNRAYISTSEGNNKISTLIATPFYYKEQYSQFTKCYITIKYNNRTIASHEFNVDRDFLEYAAIYDGDAKVDDLMDSQFGATSASVNEGQTIKFKVKEEYSNIVIRYKYTNNAYDSWKVDNPFEYTAKAQDEGIKIVLYSNNEIFYTLTLNFVHPTI